MENIKSYLRVPGLRLPSLASLRDGSFLTKALEKVDREAKKEQSFLKDFEVEIVTIKNICVTVKNICPEPACAGAGSGSVELALGQLRLGGGHSGTWWLELSTSRNFIVPGEGPCTVYGVNIEKKDRSVSTYSFDML